MHPSCRCGFEYWSIVTADGACMHLCRRCDTAAHGGSRRVGAPNLPNTADGWFNAPFGDVK